MNAEFLHKGKNNVLLVSPIKNTFIFQNTPSKIGVVSEKTYNFAPNNR